MIDRLSLRERPSGWPLMYQTWGKLLFLHWRVPAASLRSLVPGRLAIDTFDDSAWVSITPFTIWGMRGVLAPPLPGLSRTHELNLRTYVHLDGVPGVWFFSLDASNPAAVRGARFLYHLPYFRARQTLVDEGGELRFASERVEAETPPARFEARWRAAEWIGEAEPESLEFFLVERYCLYAATRRHLYRARIHHAPWPLRRAVLLGHASTLFEAHGIDAAGEPALLQHADRLDVGIWPPERV